MDIELIKHLKTGKYFVLIDDSRAGRIKVINPAGAKLVMPEEHFEEDPELFDEQQARDLLTEEQMEAAVKQAINEESQAQLMIEHLDKKKSEPKPVATARTSSPRSTGTRRKKEKVNNKKGLGATWSSHNLVFYRHHIDPLGPKQSFKIEISDIGTLQMTKEQFQSVFNEVIMDNKYRQEGYLSFDQFPEKAKRFIKGGEGNES